MTEILMMTDLSTEQKKSRKYKARVYIHENKDPNSPIIFDGYVKEAIEKFKCSDFQIRHAAFSPNHILLKLYYVEGGYEKWAGGGRPRKKKLEMKIKFKSRFEKRLDMIKRHLDMYGNTFTNRNPKKYIAALKERWSYEVKVEYRPRRVVHMVNSTDLADVYDEIYILTLLSKPEETNNE